MERSVVLRDHAFVDLSSFGKNALGGTFIKHNVLAGLN